MATPRLFRISCELRDEEIEAKVRENEELQKVCNELFQLVEQKENPT